MKCKYRARWVVSCKPEGGQKITTVCSGHLLTTIENYIGWYPTVEVKVKYLEFVNVCDATDYTEKATAPPERKSVVEAQEGLVVSPGDRFHWYSCRNGHEWQVREIKCGDGQWRSGMRDATCQECAKAGQMVPGYPTGDHSEPIPKAREEA